MLQIKDIRKKYVTGDLVQVALDGVSLTLRDNEFVAILGPSGSGKTTLLNVIGGLDRYDSGDLIINGISTKKYSDRDWDSYRNHTIGFVFQSYNLIPHQSVLANVELALTISGISHSERRKRAVKALEDVGLGNQLHKKPNQMSGGQMQRVAIARALVNNPDILLADEPTGALDSETSVQIMNLLREVARDRLVVMVTHNPELADAYANRIVRVRDGRIIDDSNPYTPEGVQAPPKHKNMGRSSMSFFTALSLSFHNLWTKKARTLLTAFAGSIGIIGIALILSLSTGFQKYIDQIQEDTLSGYPLVIQSETADMASAMAAFSASSAAAEEAEEGTVLEQPMISQMFGQIGSNDLASFKRYLEENYDQVEDAVKTVKYSYGIKPLIYKADTSEGIIQVNPGVLFNQLMGNSMMSAYMDTDVFHEILGEQRLLESQYTLLEGRWPQEPTELVLILPNPNALTDYAAYTLGLKDPEELYKMVEQTMAGQTIEPTGPAMVWTYEELMALEFKLVDAVDRYRYNAEYNVWEDMSTDTDYMETLLEEGQTLKIVGILTVTEGGASTTPMATIGYLPELTRQVIDRAGDSEIVQKQLADPGVNVFTGKPFNAKPEQSELNFEDMISVDGDKISNAFGFQVNAAVIRNMLESYMKDAVGSLNVDTTQAQKDFTDALTALATDMLNQHIAANANSDGGAVLQLSQAESIALSYLQTPGAQDRLSDLAGRYGMDKASLQNVMKSLLQGLITNYVASNYSPAPELPLPSEPEASEPAETEPAETEPVQTEPVQPEPSAEPAPVAEVEPEPSEPEPSEPAVPEVTLPPFSVDLGSLTAMITPEQVDAAVSSYVSTPLVQGTAGAMAGRMMSPEITQQLSAKLAQFGNMLMNYMGNSLTVDEDMLASAFQFEMDEDELRRLMEAMSGRQQDVSSDTNLRSLGYADLAKPTEISIFMVDFAGKERVLQLLDDYNDQMEAEGKEEQIISYVDVTGLMMSSVRTIVDSVSYVLIAFVAVSLIVSSIMIGIITYISVMERTKEIGVLRAIGASKGNISQVFNAETFIIGLCSGTIGVGSTFLMTIPINSIIHSLTGSTDINAVLPPKSALILVALSMVLTIISGLIPSGKAAKKDPVIALRSE